MKTFSEPLFHFRVAVQFLTRFPIRLSRAPSETDISRCGLYFPLIGAMIGALLWLLHYLFLSIQLPTQMTAALLLAAGYLMTGGFHIDGLADTLDGFGGSFDPNKKLEIMRDSRIGTYGTLAVVVFSLCRYAAYLNIPNEAALSYFLLPLAWGRYSSLVLIRLLPYANPSHTDQPLKKVSSKPVVENLRKSELLLASVGILVSTWLLLGSQLSLIVIISFAIAIIVLKRVALEQINGITGDVLGASNLIVEILLLCVILAHC